MKARIEECTEVLFPGLGVMKPKFPLNYIELEVGWTNDVLGLAVTPYTAKHTWQTDPTVLRVEMDNKIVAYIGDGDWSPDLPKATKDADLFITECYFHSKHIKCDLNYNTIQEH